MNRSVKRDVNHTPLCAKLRAAGVRYKDVAHHHGFGCDIIAHTVMGAGRIVFIEFKRPGPPSCRKLTESEEALKNLVGADRYFVVQTEEELWAAVGIKATVAA